MTVEQFIKDNGILTYLGEGFTSHMQHFGRSEYNKPELLREYKAFLGRDLEDASPEKIAKKQELEETGQPEYQKSKLKTTNKRGEK